MTTTECSGEYRCTNKPHYHGCFADSGDCTEVGEHEGGAA